MENHDCLEDHAVFLRTLVEKGGPATEDYEVFDSWVGKLAMQVESGILTNECVKTLLDSFGAVFDTETMQGYARCKPHGYPGDYEIIDRIYRKQTASDPQLANWDRYFHSQKAPTAVRNRKQYFLNLLDELERSRSGTELRILNLASGPARDVHEYFIHRQDHRCLFDCVDLDQNAIDFASTLCASYLHRIAFRRANVLRFQTSQKYDVIWSAGLFDYLNDKAFRMLVTRFYNYLSSEGQMVIGNFSPNNPTKHYMELIGGWRLIYRSENDLASLATDCGIASDAITVESEPAGVNLFLRIKKFTAADEGN